MPSVKDELASRKLLAGVLLPAPVDALLSGLQVVEAATAGAPGSVTLGVSAHPLFLSLNILPFDKSANYTIAEEDGGFVVAVDLSKLGPIATVLAMADAGVGGTLVPAEVHDDGAGGHRWLSAIPAPATVSLDGVSPEIRITGEPGAVASMRIAPSPGQPDGVVRIGLSPDAVLLGSSGFGLQLSQDLLVDDSEDAVPTSDAPTMIDGKPVALPGDVPSWRGISVRNARFFLPDSVPFFGRTAVETQLEIGLSPPGLAMSIIAKAPATADRGEMIVRIECMDPAATGLSSLAPTLVEATLEIPADGYQESVSGVAGGAALTLGAGKPLIARARFSRDPADPEKLTRVALALEAQGEKGILRVDGTGVAARGLIAAGAFGTILLAGGSTKQGGALTALLVAGGALSTLLDEGGSLTVNAVELESAGRGVPVTGPFRMRVDYSVDVVVMPLDIGVLHVGLDPEQPLRIRMRGVMLTVDPAKAGLSKFDLDFKHAEMDIEDPGRWLIGGPDSLFDVLGSRSGRGSIWLEIDLRFKLNLGPIKISGATVRATLDTGSNTVSVSLRGLDASLSLPGLLTGEGALALIEPEPGESGPGFTARLDAKLLPLGLGVDAFITVKPPMILLGIGVDLPGPIPLGPTGLGLFGIGGMVGIAARIELPPEAGGGDVIHRQLSWEAETGFKPEPGAFSLGLQAVVGTLADQGFSFSARAGLFLSLPDVVVLGAIDAQFMQGSKSISDKPSSDANASFRGIFSVSGDQGAAFALSGNLKIPVLLDARIPVAGRFPPGSSDWYTYIGADGFSAEDRDIGPAVVTVLPKIFPQKADGYLMLRGRGITQWPRGQSGAISIPDGFVVAFGFSKEFFFGKKKIVWAEASGGADILVATNPLVIAGFGHIEGSLHIGPASLGVSARVTAFIAKGQTFVEARVCGRIKLFFIKIEKCAKLSFGGKADTGVPLPPTIPTDQVGQDGEGNQIVLGDNVCVVDDAYRRLVTLSRDPGTAPVVWPDALIRIGLAQAPKVRPGFAPQFDPALDYAPQAQPIGSSFLKYEWLLDSLKLVDVTETADPLTEGTDVDAGAARLSATWQVGKAGDADAIAQPAELVLLTPENNLWLDRMADGGTGAPGDPLGQLGQSCHATASAVPGWALGAMANSAGMEWWLPPEFLDTDPRRSRIEGRCWLGRDRPGTGFFVFGSFDPPVPRNYSFSQGFTLGSPFKLDRTFHGGLRLPAATLNSGAEETKPFEFDALIALDDVVVSGGRVVLHYRTEDSPVAFTRSKPVIVRTEHAEWPVKISKAKNGLLLDFVMPDDDKTAVVRIRWRATALLTLLGISGITSTAAAAAAAAQAKLDAAKEKAAKAAATPPPNTAAVADPAHRCLLKPGRTYRLDLDFRWSGTLYEQDETGKAKVKDSLVDQKTYAPLGSDPADPPPAGARFFFRTAPIAHAGGGGVPQLPGYGTPDHLPDLLTRQDVFAPPMLERYLAGYEPTQSAVDRFRDDPLRVHFSVSHVAALADAYGHALELALRRVDVTGPENDLSLPKIELKMPDVPDFLKGKAARQFQIAQSSDCPVPVPGLLMEAEVELEPRAWYETYARARYTAGGVLPEPKPTDLRGVTFRTSRWRSGADMLAGIGFPKAAASTHLGDLVIAAPPFAPGSARSDGAFDAALDAIGVTGWPVAAEPRISLLWVEDGPSWLLAGLLVESPEPIDRPGRCEFESLTAKLAPLAPTVGFSRRIFDRTGSRLIFLADLPFAPKSWTLPAKGGGKKLGRLLVRRPTLSLQMTDLPPGKPATSLTGAIVLPSLPLFAMEAF